MTHAQLSSKMISAQKSVQLGTAQFGSKFGSDWFGSDGFGSDGFGLVRLGSFFEPARYSTTNKNGQHYRHNE